LISPPILLRWRAGCASALLVFKRFGDDCVDRPETPDSFVAPNEHALFPGHEIGAALSEDFDVCNRRGVPSTSCRSSRGQAAAVLRQRVRWDVKASSAKPWQASLGCLRYRDVEELLASNQMQKNFCTLVAAGRGAGVRGRLVGGRSGVASRPTGSDQSGDVGNRAALALLRAFNGGKAICICSTTSLQKQGSALRFKCKIRLEMRCSTI
jgi:hypothetical protein